MTLSWHGKWYSKIERPGIYGLLDKKFQYDVSFEEGLVRNEQRSEQHGPSRSEGAWALSSVGSHREEEAVCPHSRIASGCRRVSQQPGQKHRSCLVNCFCNSGEERKVNGLTAMLCDLSQVSSLLAELEAIRKASGSQKRWASFQYLCKESWCLWCSQVLA